MEYRYNGLGELMKSLDLTNPEELREAFLGPSTYQKVWKRAQQRVGGHDWHELSFLHDTLCFIQDYDGRVERERIAELGDHIQNSTDYIETCLIPALEELDLVMWDGDKIQLTERSSRLQYSPRFLPVLSYAEDQ